MLKGKKVMVENGSLYSSRIAGYIDASMVFSGIFINN